ncbi:hypothetical protein BpHYR1_039531 [Brachionus plicatilis]|uniref:RING-type E3 ubiquitin transferase n=1 Tax=Brachionus plicatilis TaxID=10195 RepID=A0A3M7SS88_BRAPC|nr:hypothetical protein BpHYR1_039531 [Brachionus plicatilis]
MSSNNPRETISEALIGYCHQCDRQVEIDRQSFTCTQCQGGFIELFEMGRDESRVPNTEVHGEPMRLNNANNAMQNLLPLLLSNFINQSGAQTGTQPTQTPPRPQRFGTRVQFIVPGNRLAEPGQEQFDLYGIINNVISDLLDPNRSGQNIQAPPFHTSQREYISRPPATSEASNPSAPAQTSGPEPPTSNQNTTNTSNLEQFYKKKKI